MFDELNLALKEANNSSSEVGHCFLLELCQVGSWDLCIWVLFHKSSLFDFFKNSCICFNLLFRWNFVENSCKLQWIVWNSSVFDLGVWAEQSFDNEVVLDVYHFSCCLLLQHIFFIWNENRNHSSWCGSLFEWTFRALLNWLWLWYLFAWSCFLFIWQPFLFIEIIHEFSVLSIAILLKYLLHFLFCLQLFCSLLLLIVLEH